MYPNPIFDRYTNNWLSWLLYQVSCSHRRRISLCMTATYPHTMYHRLQELTHFIVEWSAWIYCRVCRFEGQSMSRIWWTFYLTQARYLNKRRHRNFCHLDGNDLESSAHSLMAFSYWPWVLVYSYNLSNDSFPWRVSFIASLMDEETANRPVEIEQPKLVVIIGCVGLGLNILSVCFLHGLWYISFIQTPFANKDASQTMAILTVTPTAIPTERNLVMSRPNIKASTWARFENPWCLSLSKTKS